MFDQEWHQGTVRNSLTSGKTKLGVNLASYHIQTADGHEKLFHISIHFKATMT